MKSLPATRLQHTRLEVLTYLPTPRQQRPQTPCLFSQGVVGQDGLIGDWMLVWYGEVGQGQICFYIPIMGVGGWMDLCIPSLLLALAPGMGWTRLLCL